jgi:hypothetical protein
LGCVGLRQREEGKGGSWAAAQDRGGALFSLFPKTDFLFEFQIPLLCFEIYLKLQTILKLSE